ncbi:MAG TPA: ubiquinone/menaquinone biosynthesis methyltransferase [Bacteroidales bacterium]|nr:ubiquinone/menaquinone biosynthesis methyltransferase [Bacteroidales bacterium]
MEHPLQHYYSRIYRTYDLVNRLFTFGLDKKWRKITVNECLSVNPRNVLDLCCGTGDLAIEIQKKAGTNCTVTGFDLNPEMLSVASHKSEKDNLNIEFIRGDAATMPFTDESFDCITIGFGFRNLTWQNPSAANHIAEISRVLKIGGKLLILESSQPSNGFIRFFYSVYLKSVLVPLGGILSGNWNAYRYLAGSSAGFYTFNELRSMLEPFGLDLHMKHRFLFGSANLLEVIKSAK